jgi:hypothetical protein
MNADLTYNSVAFKKQFDENGSSLRQSTTRGLDIPDRLVVKHQPYVDPVTKIAGTRHIAEFQRTSFDAENVHYVSKFSFTMSVPSIETSAPFAVLVATFKAAVADADLIPAVLNGEL